MDKTPYSAQLFLMFKRLTICFLMFLSKNVIAQSSLISTTKTNVLYQWIENPIQIAVEDYPCERLVAKVDYGKLVGKGCNYIYKSESHTITKAKIRIGLKHKKGIKWVDSMNIRVKPLPDPIVSFAMAEDGDSVNKVQILANPYVAVPIRDLELHNNPWRQKVTSFTLKIVRKDSIIFEENNFNPSGNFYIDSSYELNSKGDTVSVDYTNRSISKSAIAFIRDNMLQGDYIVIENIIVVLYGLEERRINSSKYFVIN